LVTRYGEALYNGGRERAEIERLHLSLKLLGVAHALEESGIDFTSLRFVARSIHRKQNLFASCDSDFVLHDSPPLSARRKV
jgi:hypothetical protein